MFSDAIVRRSRSLPDNGCITKITTTSTPLSTRRHETIAIDGINFDASRVLFMLDREAYRDALLAFHASLETNGSEAEET